MIEGEESVEGLLGGSVTVMIYDYGCDYGCWCQDREMNVNFTLFINLVFSKTKALKYYILN